MHFRCIPGSTQSRVEFEYRLIYLWQIEDGIIGISEYLELPAVQCQNE